jgi:hypothetical protein
MPIGYFINFYICYGLYYFAKLEIFLKNTKSQPPYKLIKHLPVPLLAFELFIEPGAGQADGGFGAFQDIGHPSRRDVQPCHPADAQFYFSEINSPFIDFLAEVWP